MDAVDTNTVDPLPGVSLVPGDPAVADQAEPLPPLRPAGHAGPLPLSVAQERLWVLQRMRPENVLDPVAAALKLGGRLDVAALEHALGEVVRRHDVLRTTFPESDGAPVQKVAPFRGFTLPVEDLSGAGDEEVAAAVLGRAAEEAARPFDLAAGPLFRATLLKAAKTEHVLLLSLHPLVGDAASVGVLFRELGALYGARREGRAPPLPGLPVQYADYAVWQREVLRGAVLEPQLAWWTARLAGAPALLELPTDRPRPAVQSFRGASERIDIPAGLVARLRALGRSEDATLLMVLLGAFQLVLARWSGSDDIVVGAPVPGRARGEVEGLIGAFENALAMRTGFSGDPGFREVLRRVRATVLGAYQRQEVPFARLVEALAPERTLSHTPIFQAELVLRDDAPWADGLAGLQVAPVEVDAGAARCDLTLAFAPAEGGVRGRLAYATDLFDRPTIARLADHVRRVLEQVAADPELRVSELELVAPGERTRIVEAWNRTAAAYPAGRCIHQLFEAQAARTPHAVAVTCGAASLTYRELDEKANHLANHLVALGVGPEVRVGICLERSLEVMVALLGVMKAGGAYVPVDPSHPAERIAYVLGDSSVALLLTQERLRARLAPHGTLRVVAIDAQWPEIVATGGTAPETGVTSENLCYVIYTSGSTGRPKGVAMHHRGVVNYIHWGVAAYGAASGSGAPVFSSLAVDLTLTNLLPLFAGHPVHFLPEENAVEALAGVLRTKPRFGLIKITPVHLTLLTPFLSPQEAREAAVTLVIGADFLSAEPTVFWQDHAPGVRLMNEYGPTETVVGCSAYVLPNGVHRHGPVPVGGPIDNLTFFVLDERMRPVPVGLPGELYIGGAGVARGYLGRPALSAEKFVPDPFAGGGARMYRTGDRARWLEGGNLLILGRTDNQVKIRGYRVELGEIEAVLRRRADVTGAIVVAREDVPGDRRIVAYVTGRPDPDALRDALRRELPEYMVPSAFVVMETLPQTATGKVDPKTLPVPGYASPEESHVAPRTPAEETIAEIWSEVLDVPRVSADDDFFALGGQSLLAMRFLFRLRAALGVELPIAALLEAPTVEAVARRVERLRAAAERPAGDEPPLVAVPRGGPLPVTELQRTIWFGVSLTPDGARRQSISEIRLRGPLDLGALRRALDEVVRRHESLRTVIREQGGELVQVVLPPAPAALLRVELRGAPAALRARGLRAAAVYAGFDLEHGPLFRTVLARTGAREWQVFFLRHVVISDNWSGELLIREVSALYSAFAAGRPSPLAGTALQYGDWAAWEAAWLTPARREAVLAYWRASLDGATPLSLARDGGVGWRTSLPLTLSGALLDDVRELAQREQCTLFMVLLAAFKLLLARYTGQEDLCVTTPLAGRIRPETERMIGLFSHAAVLRTDLSGDPPFRALLARVRAATLGAFAHQEISYIERLDAPAEEMHRLRALCRMAFGCNVDVTSALRLEGLEVEWPPAEGAPVGFDTLAFEDRGDRVDGTFAYRAALYDPELPPRLVRDFQAVLARVAADPDLRVWDVPLGEPAAAVAVAAGDGDEADFAF